MSTNEIHLEIVNKRIHLRTRYDPLVPVQCKKVHGAKWEPVHKVWSYPLSWDSCVAIRRDVATPLDRPIAFGDEIFAWATEEKQRQAKLDAARQGLGDGLGLREIPGVKTRNPKIYEAATGRPFQSAGIEFGAEHKKLILADDPGLGKTLQTLGVIEETATAGPILVVCNTSAQQVTWPREIEFWTSDEYLVFDKDIPPNDRDDVIRDVFKDCANDPQLRIWVLMNPYWVRMKAEVDEYGKYIRSTTGVKMVSVNVPPLFNSGDWAAIVADESHETLACNTGNAKKWSQQRQGMGALPLREDGVRISISGTPMRGKSENMFGQLNWIAPEEYTSYWNWAKKHFVVSNDGYRGAMNVGELIDETAFFEENARYMLRRSKEQVASDLPPKRYGGTPFDKNDPDSLVGVWLEMLPEQRKALDAFESEAGLVDEENGLELTAIGFLAQLTRRKQFASTCGRLVEEQRPAFEKNEKGRYLKDADDKKIPAYDPKTGKRLFEDVVTVAPELPSCKFNWILNFLDERDLLNGGKGKSKVIIASQFTRVINEYRRELSEKYDTESFHITGETKIKDRKKFQDEFQNNPDSPKIFFLQSIAGGTSLTLDQADDVIINDEMWDFGVQEQIEDRAHRLSRTDHNVTIWYLRTLDTVEEYIGTTADARRSTVKGVMDGQRGVDIRRKLLTGA